MDEQMLREIRVLRACTIVAMGTMAVVLFMGFTDGRATRFGEIDVERINIVEADGQLRMVISNRERQHPGIADGDTITRSGPRPPGILFFNHRGDEMGGLVFAENGGNGHFGQLTLDKVAGDQTIGFRHLESDDGKYTTALQMWQQPLITLPEIRAEYEAADTIRDPEARRAAIQAMRDRGHLPTTRLFLGKDRTDATRLEMSDIMGRARIRMTVADDGTTRLEFLDEDGNVTLRLPGDAG